MSLNVPSEIIQAALLVSNWMKENGQQHWELADICSRNHVDLPNDALTWKIQELEKLAIIAQDLYDYFEMTPDDQSAVEDGHKMTGNQGTKKESLLASLRSQLIAVKIAMGG